MSPSETSYLAQSPFTAVSLPGIIVHRKSMHPYGQPLGDGGYSVPSHERFPAALPLRLTSDLNPLVERLSTTQTKREEQPVVSPPSLPLKRVLKPAPVPTHPSAIYEEAKILYEQGRYAEVHEKLHALADAPE